MSFETGQSAEAWVAKYLEGKGYKIIERNWKCKRGEIDLIALKKDTLYFVEVKYRRNRQYGNGAEAISQSKLKKMALTALSYIQLKDLFKSPIAFSAAIVEEKEGLKKIDFFEFPLDLPLKSYY